MGLRKTGTADRLEHDTDRKVAALQHAAETLLDIAAVLTQGDDEAAAQVAHAYLTDAIASRS